MNFKEKLDIIFESPDIMKIKKSEPGSYGFRSSTFNDPDAITFGWYKGSLFNCREGSPIQMDGKPLPADKIQDMLEYLYDIDVEHNVGIQSEYKELDWATGRNARHSENTHSELIDVAVEYFRLLKLHTFISNNKDTITSDIISKAMFDINKQDSEDRRQVRKALQYAGRIFPSIKGISFWSDAPSKNKILELLKVAGESPEDYIIEEDGGRRQFPLEDRRFKTQGHETDETELARKMLAQRIQKVKKQHYAPKKDIHTNFYNTVGG